MSRRLWTRQPQVVPSGFNPRFPRPSFVYVPSLLGGRYDLSQKLRGTPASGDALRPTPQGIAYKVANAINGGLDFGTMQPLSDSFTLIVVANPQSANAQSTFFSQRSSSGQINFIANGLNASGPSAGRVAAWVSDSSGNVRGTHTASATLVDGAYHVFAAIRAGLGSDTVIWMDGVFRVGEVAGTLTGSNVNSTQKVRVGNLANYSADAIYCASCDVALVLGFNATLSDAQMRRLGETLLAPYRIFVDQPRRIWVPESAASLAASITESASAGESSSCVVTIAASVTETASGTDSAASILVATSSVTESAVAADAASSAFAATASITESASAVDSSDATNAGEYSADVTESATATDTSTVSTVGNYSASATEAATAGESSSLSASLQAAIAEGATALETALAGLSVSASIIETVTASELSSVFRESLASILESATAIDISASSLFVASPFEDSEYRRYVIAAENRRIVFEPEDRRIVTSSR